MKAILLPLFTLAVIAFPMTARAFSPTPEELHPGKETNGRIFEISAEKLPTNEIRFTVRMRFPYSFSVEDYAFGLSDVEVVESEKPAQGAIPAHTSEHINIRAVRKVVVQQDGDMVTCIFTVSPKELEDPLLSFAFFQVPHEIQPEIPLTWYAPLAKYRGQ